jgi:hypothetical protein
MIAIILSAACLTAPVPAKPEEKKIDCAAYTGHFEKNNSGLKGDASQLVFTDSEAFGKIFGTLPPVGARKSTPLPVGLFEKNIVMVVITRGTSTATYSDVSTTISGTTLTVHYKAALGAPTTATFSSPLILSVPKEGIKTVVFLGNEVQVHDVRDHITATIDGSNESPLASQRGHLVRVELRLSQLGLEVWTSPPSEDGVVFEPLVRRRSVVFSQPLGFSRGHVQLLAHNHATWKYGITYADLPSPLRSWNVYWDNIGFDGPFVQPPREYEVPVSAVPHTFTTVTEHPAGVFTTVVHPGLSLGYVMPDGANALGAPPPTCAAGGACRSQRGAAFAAAWWTPGGQE